MPSPSPSPRRPVVRLLLAVLLLLPALALAACGGGDDDGPAATTTGASAGRFPATVVHKFGTTTVPKAPQRVVAVGYNDQDFALALGVRPVGAREFVGSNDVAKRPWAQQALGGATPEIIGAQDLNVERIAALRPDLILGVYSGITRKEYDLLTRLAPTVAQQGAYPDFGEPWQRQMLQTGEALGRRDEAARVVARTEARIAKVRRAEGFEGKTLVMASGSTDQIAVYSSQDLRPRFFTDLGFATPKRIDRMAGRQFYADVSDERLDVLNADVLVVYGSREQLLRRPAFAALEVVREGRVIYLDPASDLADALGFSSPLSIPYAIDGFLPLLRAAADGDPATKVPAAEGRAAGGR